MTGYNITEEAFIEANKYVSRKRVWVATGLALILTWLLYYFFRPLMLDLMVLSVASVLAILIFILGIPVLQRFGYRRIYHKNPVFQQEQAFSMDHEGVELRSKQGQVRYKFSDLIKIEETKNLILLFPTTQVFHILPKELLDEQVLNDLLLKK